MKNFFSSPSSLPDFQNFSLSLEIIKKQNRELRDDLIDVKKRLTALSRQITMTEIIEREGEYPQEELQDVAESNTRGS